MRGEFLYTKGDGKSYHLGDLVRLEYDEDFSQWNELSLERHGMLVGVITYKGLSSHEDILAEVLVDGRRITFEWDDIEAVHAER